MKHHLVIAAIAAIGLGAAAHADTKLVAVYETNPDTLWETVDFHQPSENIMPPIASSARSGEGIGATKINTLANGGGKVHLQLVHYSPEERAFNYTIQESPLPVKNYVGLVRVSEAGAGRAQLTWEGIYEPNGVPAAKADEILAGFYAAIAEKIGGSFKRIR